MVCVVCVCCVVLCCSSPCCVLRLCAIKFVFGNVRAVCSRDRVRVCLLVFVYVCLSCHDTVPDPRGEGGRGDVLQLNTNVTHRFYTRKESPRHFI